MTNALCIIAFGSMVGLLCALLPQYNPLIDALHGRLLLSVALVAIVSMYPVAIALPSLVAFWFGGVAVCMWAWHVGIGPVPYDWRFAPAIIGVNRGTGYTWRFGVAV